MVALMLRQVVGFYSRFQFKNMGNAQTSIYIIFNTNLLHNIFINYCSDMFWPQFFAIFREHIWFVKYAAYMWTYLAAVLHIWLKLKLKLKSLKLVYTI